MIKNEKQYQVTKQKLQEFKESLTKAESRPMDPLERELFTGAFKSQVEDLNFELEEYEHLKRGEITAIYSSFPCLPEALIKGRIANGWTQADLALKTGLKEQQIQRYESCNYSTASFPRIVAIADIVGLQINDIKATVRGVDLHVRTHTPERLQYAKEKLRMKKTLIAFN
jgi:HTH-type transcriptional regulator/antitoxin HipB